MTLSELATASVRLYGEEVGTLSCVGVERTLFSFHESYVKNPKRPTLGLRFKDQFGQLINEFRPYKVKLMPFFSNLLPEGILRNYLARKIEVHPDREFHLLCALGQDLPGAITIVPLQGGAWPGGVCEEPVADPSADDGVLRFSLAGVQLKFSAVKDSHGGLTIPAKGVGGDWIVKLPSGQFPLVPENEFSMMTLARKVGIEVPVVDLVDVDSIGNLPSRIQQLGSRAFLIQRFDRSAEGLVHIEDFAQVFDVYPQDKYKKASFRNLLSVIASESDHHEVAEFVRRLTFNVLIGNGDMHLKNWSLIYPDRRRARLSPAYDFVSTLPYIADERSALTFSRTKAFTGYTLDELVHLATRAAVPRKLVIATATETVSRFMDLWPAEKGSLPLDERVVQTVDRHLASLPLVTQRA